MFINTSYFQIYIINFYCYELQQDFENVEVLKVTHKRPD